MITVFFLVGFAVTCANVNAVSVEEEWEKFQTLYERSYSEDNERDGRYSVFKENLQKIREHNALYETGKVTYKLGVNQFSAWTSEEFLRYVNKFKISKTLKDVKVHRPLLNVTKVSDSHDWRLHLAVTDVRNQGHCGSCWTFAAVGALEGQAAISLRKRIRLSEQNLLDCAVENYGCNGGDTNSAYLYVQSNGIQSEQSYPYVAHQYGCRQSSAEVYVSDFFSVTSSEEALKMAVFTIGPISAAIDSTAELQHYAGGIFLDRTCTTDRLNHAVLIVGYGNEGGQDYWLVKNSWGTSWGENGYFRLARNKYNNCGIVSYISFPVVSDKKS